MKKTVLNTSLSTALWTALVVTLGISVSACSSSDDEAATESGEVMAVDRVDAAAELARKNGPEAEDMAFEETTPMATADAEVDMATAEEPTAASDMSEATATDSADVPDAPDTDTAAAASTETDGAAKPEGLAANAGKQLYEVQCHVCHEKGLLGAPKFGNKADWAPHISKDIETLHMHSAKGFNKMPAQASDTVSEAQVHAAVDYMVAAAS